MQARASSRWAPSFHSRNLSSNAARSCAKGGFLGAVSFRVHGSDADDDPARFRVTIILDEQANGKTVLTLRQLHPTVEQRDATIGFGAVELALQTIQKLAHHLGSPESPGR